MTPTPQESVQDSVAAPAIGGDTIVISGISGLFPKSHNIKEFSEMLYNKVNPISSDDIRFKCSHPEVVQLAGNIPDLDCFDAQFFKVHYHLAIATDPMSRKILEQAYQAIYDAGVNPSELNGKRIGVYVGTCFSESEKTRFYETKSKTGFSIAGCCKSMFANRISYWLNTKGPSMAIDESCCSSIAALEQAYDAISRGECEAAIVGSAFLGIHPQITLHLGRMIKLCADGKTKSFCENADGCAKSEAVNVMFLKKAKDARRIYADVLHVKTEYVGLLKGETGPKYGFFRNPSKTADFLKKFYRDANLPPQAIEYVEAFGCAIPEAERSELEALEEVFCKDRKDPLLIGSVMSNIGYGEATSGISGVTKVLLGFHNGSLAANLHCERPRRDVPALADGRMRVLADHQEFSRSYAAVNGVSVTGVNSHVLLHGHYKPKDTSRYKSSIPRLVTVSARQESSIQRVFDDLKSRPIDPEQLALLYNIHQKNIPGYLGRGFVILDTDEEKNTISLCEKATHFDNARRPLWFVYSGMGSQWAGMGAQLMRIPIFAAAIERCAKVLQPKGIEIVHIITSSDKTIYKNILHSFVGIAAVQIGLTDILRELGLVPDGIIGHSVGELGCAYADGCLTAEEMILSAYSRGLVSLQTPFIRGSMAAVGLGFEQVSPMLPPEIEVACHNGPVSSTISGPADVMQKFVKELTEKGVFAKEVPCSNIAYHSRYIADAGPGLLKYLSEVIKTPKARSDRWLSTSVPKDKWDEPLAQYSSAEYHTNNLLSPVLFEETSRLVPENAVLVEVAPHGLLQAILTRSLPNCVNIALTRRNHPDNAYMLLEAIGKLFMEGYYPVVQALYPKVEFPVSTGTPHLSHLVEWAHVEKWALPLYNCAQRTHAAALNTVISLHDEEYKFLRGNVVRGQTVYPLAAVLVNVWDTFCMTMGVPKKQKSVEFRDLQLYAQPTLNDQSQLRLRVTIQRGTRSFEVLNEDTRVVTGIICSYIDQNPIVDEESTPNDDLVLSADDVYQLLYERDYAYGGEFRSIVSANSSLSSARVRGDWVTLVDGVLQLIALRQPHSSVCVPEQIRRFSIDVKAHAQSLEVADGAPLTAEVFEKYSLTRCGGILMENVKFRNIPPMKENKMCLQLLKFVPYFNTQQNTIEAHDLLQVYLQIVAENANNKKVINIVGVTNGFTQDCVFNDINDRMFVKVNYKTMSRKEVRDNSDDFGSNVDLVIVQNLSTDDELRILLHKTLPRDVFVLSEEDQTIKRPPLPSTIYLVVAAHSVPGAGHTRQLELMLWRPTPASAAISAFTVRTSADVDFLKSVYANLNRDQRLLVFSHYPPLPEIFELVTRWREEVGRNRVHLVVLKNQNDYDVLDSTPEVYLTRNVIENGVLGGEYYITTPKSSTESKRLINGTLKCEEFGDFNSLSWVEASEPIDSGINVLVHYAGINRSDIKKASGAGLFDSNNSYGMDYSGVTEYGERVMGLVASGACSSRVRAVPELLWPVPAHWNLEDAATVPLAYAHAFYCLAIKGNLNHNMTVLVHGGAGGLGQAAISIALAYKCQVFTTVSDTCKKRFLQKLFPELKAEHIGNSRDHTFADLVISATKGDGCNIIMSTVREDLKNPTLHCARYLGRIVDVTEILDQDNYEYGMYHLTQARSYIASDFKSIFNDVTKEHVKSLQLMISEGIARGYVRPLSRVTYEARDASRAFRLMAGGVHRGRVLLRMLDLNEDLQPRLKCSPNSSHVVFCDEAILGTQLVERLVNRGARKVLLHLEQQKNVGLQVKMRSWQKLGAQIEVSTIKLDEEENMAAFLLQSNDMGPVESINVVLNADTKHVQESHVSKLDMLSRKLYPKLKRFAVMNIGGTVGRYTCLSRSQNNYPATMVVLPDAEQNGAWYRSAMDALERALDCGYPVQRALPLHEPSSATLLQHLATLIGEKQLNNVNMSTTLNDLAVEGDKLDLISTYLRNELNLSYTTEQLQALSIERIIELEKITKVSAFEEVKGLKTFFKYVDPDEILATTDLVFLPTLTSSSSMRDDEFDSNLTYLCIVPGLEGHHKEFRVLCERLKLPALVLQPGLDNPHETSFELAQRYVKVLINKIGLKENFYLLGYESGVLVALQIAAILEDMGMTGTVFCVGCAPNEFRAVVDHQLRHLDTEEKLQNAVALHMFSLLAGGDAHQLQEELERAPSWTEKVDAAVRALHGRVSHSAQYARAQLEAALARLHRARDDNVAPRALRSRLVLLRAADGYTPVDECSDECTSAKGSSLAAHSMKEVCVHALGAPLGQAAQDIRCAAIVNRHLPPEILNDFDNKNVCDTYLLNANCYMSIPENE